MLRRTGALLCSATVLATMLATVASPASAAKPRCQGLPATIVGTAKGEVIVGTAGRDIIVARGGPDSIYGKGGNDLICAGTGNDIVYGGPGADTVWGQAGNDRLDGGPGPDFLAGQIGNDTLDGGLQIDECYQGTGSGPVVNCELPAPPAPPPPLDRDGDGYIDAVDVCPNQGDQGYGVDATGCPKPPPPTFKSVCEGAGGTYSAGGSYQYNCEWAAGTVDQAVWESLITPLSAFCTEVPGSVFGVFNFPNGPANLGCLAAP